MTLTTKSFDVAEQQGVLVITPAGDTLSFRDVDIQREGSQILEYLKQSETKRLVVDLSRSKYYGSLMIGIIHSFGQTVKDQGGQMYTCGASDQMQSVLKIMKLDELWPNFPNRIDAVKVAKAWK